MNRRKFLAALAALPVVALLPRPARKDYYEIEFPTTSRAFASKEAMDGLVSEYSAADLDAMLQRMWTTYALKPTRLFCAKSLDVLKRAAS